MKDEPANETSEQAEPKFGEADNIEVTNDIRQRLYAVWVNVLIVGYLFIAMYFAAQDQENLTPVFFKVFFSLLIPTLFISAFIKRKLFAKRKP